VLRHFPVLPHLRLSAPVLSLHQEEFTLGEHPRNAWFQQWNTVEVLWWFGQQHRGTIFCWSHITLRGRIIVREFVVLSYLSTGTPLSLPCLPTSLLQYALGMQDPSTLLCSQG
jgi:hypothetical protein